MFSCDVCKQNLQTNEEQLIETNNLQKHEQQQTVMSNFLFFYVKKI